MPVNKLYGTAPDVNVPTPVKDELVIFVASDVPDKVPASATIVMSDVPSNATPLIFLGVANLIVEEAVVAKVAVAAFPVVF